MILSASGYSFDNTWDISHNAISAWLLLGLCHKIKTWLSFLGVPFLNLNLHPTDISWRTIFLLVVSQSCIFFLYLFVWLLCVFNISTNIWMLLQPSANTLFKLYPLAVEWDAFTIIQPRVKIEFFFHSGLQEIQFWNRFCFNMSCKSGGKSAR